MRIQCYYFALDCDCTAHLYNPLRAFKGIDL